MQAQASKRLRVPQGPLNALRSSDAGEDKGDGTEEHLNHNYSLWFQSQYAHSPSQYSHFNPNISYRSYAKHHILRQDIEGYCISQYSVIFQMVSFYNSQPSG